MIWYNDLSCSVSDSQVQTLEGRGAAVRAMSVIRMLPNLTLRALI